MSNDCLGCVCTRADRSIGGGRLILSTRVDHTRTALRSLALRKGVALRHLAPGLLSLESPDVEAFVADAARELSSVEADEVRCAVVGSPDLSDVEVLSLAMSAPTLAASAARLTHADLLPLFDYEQASFHAVYQPIVELGGRRAIGYESLLRAVTPDGAPVLPAMLFPAAEAAGWTHLLDRVGRTTALRDAGPWLDDELLFINFVPTSIYRPEVCLRTTEAAARAAGVRLDQLVFEVTEGHEVRDVDHLQRVFAYYRSRGCRVAMDDVGAGYSSLNLLVALQPDVVKIDKDVVQALPGEVSSAVVAAIVSITHAYGGLVLAECVETEEQAQAALDLGVDLGQGWLFGRPEQHATTVTRTAGTHPGGAGTAETARSRRPVDPALPDVAVALDPSRPGVDVVRAALAPDGRDPVDLGPLLARAVEAGVSGVVIVDVLAPGEPIIHVNPAFERLTGYPAAEVVGRNCRLLQGADTDRAAVRALRAAIAGGEEHATVLRNYRKDGSGWWNELHLSPVRDADSRLTHYLGFQHDVTTRIESERQLMHQAAHDSLTGLANRATLVEQLDAALSDAAGQDRSLAVLFLDLDGFKAVNDTLGHQAGDGVLEQVAQRLRASLRADDLLARNGGDEFVAVLTGLDPLDAARVARRAALDLEATLRRPVTVDGHQARVGGTVGIALYPDDASSSEALLACADAAMYRTKSALRTARAAAVPAQQAAAEEAAVPSAPVDR